MNVLKMYGAAILSLGLIFFILMRLFTRHNSMKNSIVALIIGVIISSIIGTFMIIDYENGIKYPFSFNSTYYAFIITSVALTIFSPIICLIIGKTKKQKLKDLSKEYQKAKPKPQPTINDEVDNLYLAFKHDGNFLLKEMERNGIIEYTSLIVKFPKNSFFHDDLIGKVIDDLKLDINTYKFVGEALKKGEKKDENYYCYIIDINEITEKIDDYKEISTLELYNYNLSDFNKQIIYHMILQDNFKIEV